MSSKEKREGESDEIEKRKKRNNKVAAKAGWLETEDAREGCVYK